MVESNNPIGDMMSIEDFAELKELLFEFVTIYEPPEGLTVKELSAWLNDRVNTKIEYI